MNWANVSEFVKRVMTAAVLTIFFGGAYLHSIALFTLLLLSILFIILYFEWPRLVDTKNSLVVMLSFFYPTLPVIGIIALNIIFHDKNVLLPLYPFLVSWSADTAGYVVGKLCGKHKIYPIISPGKSWEGFAGSFIGVLLVNVFVLKKINLINSSLLQNSFIMFVVFFSALLTIVALLGGFFLSFLKRRKGLKDAGSLLPGHGGLLDRFDSVFFVIIVFWIFILFSK
jgi:phosphatidate cytidylyltransferase